MEFTEISRRELDNRQSKMFWFIPCRVSTHICRLFFFYLSQSCYTFYNRLTLGRFISPDTFRSVSLLRGMSPSKLGQWDSSSAPKGAGSRSRAARPTQKQKHTSCCKPPQSSADTAWRTSGRRNAHLSRPTSAYLFYSAVDWCQDTWIQDRQRETSGRSNR